MSSHVFLPRPVAGFGFRGWLASQAVHEPFVVVPVHPGAGDLFQVSQGADRPGPERGILADALSLVQPDRRLRQGVVQGIPDRADRGCQPGQQQGLGEPDRGVLRPGVGIKPSSA